MPSQPQEKNTRRKLFEMQLGLCVHCLEMLSLTAPNGNPQFATLDHIVPTSLVIVTIGHYPDSIIGCTVLNVRLSCEKCNIFRRNVSLPDFWNSPYVKRMRAKRANWIPSNDMRWMEQVWSDTLALHRIHLELLNEYPHINRRYYYLLRQRAALHTTSPFLDKPLEEAIPWFEKARAYVLGTGPQLT